MKERLMQLLDLEQLTPSKFADLIGVQRSSVSHVISGRNNPSFDFIQKTLRAFPGLHAEWLILGEGSMYEQMGRAAPGNLFETPEEQQESLFPEHIPAGGTEIAGSSESQELKQEEDNPVNDSEPALNQTDNVENQTHLPKKEAKAVQVMVFYEDNTFKTYQPSE